PRCGCNPSPALPPCRIEARPLHLPAGVRRDAGQPDVRAGNGACGPGVRVRGTPGKAASGAGRPARAAPDAVRAVSDGARDAAVAVTLEAAAAAAAARSAVAAAADMAEQALALTPSDLVGDRARRARMAAEWRFWAGQTARAATLSDLAVELAPSGPELARA